ncbi:MAG: hypothetical protein ACTSXF_10885 [Promethearchaeota archaeon]
MPSEKFYQKMFFPLVIILALFGLLLARLFWPATGTPYSDAWDTISGLGNVTDNPFGFYGFQISLVCIGIGVLYIFLYSHPRIVALNKSIDRSQKMFFFDKLMTLRIMVYFGSFWMIIGALGLLLTGFIPDNTITSIKKFHEITSGMGFGGVMFASFFYFFTFKYSTDKISKKLLIFLTLLWWTGIILTAVAYGIAELHYKPLYDLGWYGADWGAAGVPVFYSFALWERIDFAIMIIYTGLLEYLIPQNIER